MNTAELTDLSTAATTANVEITKTKNSIDKAQEDVQLAADIVAGVLLGVAVITMVLSVLNFWRLLIIFSVLTSLILIATWIVVGALAAVGVFLDDLCYTMDLYVQNPDSVSISKEIPCPDAKDVVQFGSKFREQINIMVHDLNDKVITHNGRWWKPQKIFCARPMKSRPGITCAVPPPNVMLVPGYPRYGATNSQTKPAKPTTGATSAARPRPRRLRSPLCDVGLSVRHGGYLQLHVESRLEV